MTTRNQKGKAGDPLYAARRTLHTGVDLLTDKQRDRLDALFANDAHAAVRATWSTFQRMISAHLQPDRKIAKRAMTRLIEAATTAFSAGLSELRRLGRTLQQRAGDILTYFDRPGTSNGPTEELNGPPRAPPRLRPRLPQPDQLHRQIATGDRRVQTATTTSIVKSRKAAVRVHP